MTLNNSGGFRSRSKKNPEQQGNRQQTSGASGNRGGNRTSSQSHQQGQGRRTRSASDVYSRAGVDPARAAALHVLQAVRSDDAYANLVLPGLLRERKIAGRDAAFATEITYGTLRNLRIVDAVIDAASTRELSSIAPQLLDILRLGTYQLLFTRVEAHAAVDQSVRAVEAIGQERAKGFVNGILRTVSRTKPETWLTRLTPADELSALAFKHSHPDWIARSFAEVVGMEELGAALEADSERPIVHLVARPGEISAEELALISGGSEAQFSPYGVYLEAGDPGKLEPVREGLAAVQDEGSQLIARALTQVELNGEDQGRWLDLCAGPGGKSALIGALARIDGAHVDAVEIAPHRAKLVSQAVQGLPVTVHVADGRDPDLQPGYDRILVDAPCSGLGALRRRPEARWRKQESDLEDLSHLQFELLESATKLVRPGGAIVYSTCSPDLRETRAIVTRAKEELGMVELDAHPLAGGMVNVGTEQSVQMWPHRHGTDAMFFAVLRKPE
ncbi:RsmB/NOP family class I SAM-dependent RNA methyltransferase [Corynebacterium epidermidicanis]|uniref:tRNA/rRNA cytosine-C5-methylase n=1 Tax=Corynebacterium epidermidicanis TaxID=1050174 RepID=A0A0G3GUM8_9CORY|nr:transcription antitermination factor NusB [Corynebacterium epidermidicanis]AKK03223.1 tRNA/rRNA cytosine-C5-methylase [Corynebacterium epidermidicanis]